MARKRPDRAMRAAALAATASRFAVFWINDNIFGWVHRQDILTADGKVEIGGQYQAHYVDKSRDIAPIGKLYPLYQTNAP